MLHMVTIEIAINSTRGAQHFAVHPAGIALPVCNCLHFTSFVAVKIAVCGLWQPVEAASSDTDPNVSSSSDVPSSSSPSVAASSTAPSTGEPHTTLSVVHLGRLLLQKMGWKEGEGLGKDSSGPTAPLILDMKKDRKGARDTAVFHHSLLYPTPNRRGH